MRKSIVFWLTIILVIIAIWMIFVGCLNFAVLDKEPVVLDKEPDDPIILKSGWEPTTLTITGVLEITFADSIDRPIIVKWLDSNKVQIDEGAKMFFDYLLKGMCDEYIKSKLPTVEYADPNDPSSDIITTIPSDFNGE